MIDLFPPVLLSGTPEDPFYIMEYWTTIPQSIATAMVYRFLGNLDPLNIPTQAMQLTGTISTIPILIPAIGVKKLLSAYNQWVSQGTNPAPFLYSLTLGTTPVQVTIPTQVLVTIFTMMHANLYGSPIADFVGNLLIRFPQQLQDFGPADGTPTGIYD